MNCSFFSSFDAVCAEVLAGKSVRAATISSSSSAPPPPPPKSAHYHNTKTDHQPISRKAKAESKPRFAPELDGLNCFETLISC
ncbi:UNVERIFIED_CONTAM: hypothetical protein Sradi_5710700 [Sesamum radiatum]|uniref:Uncharacterized protein n=1 Tax=Sesamum radiatum TaxID=300843 RepID=A0AAW2L2N4_SESRA